MRNIRLLAALLFLSTITFAQTLQVSCEIVAQIPCSGRNLGAVETTVAGGIPPYTYTWSDERLKGPNPRNIAKGRYTITVKDARGVAKSATVTLNEPPPLILMPDEIVGVSEKGAKDGSIRVEAKGGSGTYTYEWENGATTQKMVGLAEGKYNIRVSDSYNCRTSGQFSIEAPEETIAEEIVIEEEEIIKTPAAETPVEEAPVVTALEAANNVTEFTVGQTLQVEKLYFKADAADIKEESLPVLDDIYEFLINNKVVVEIGGHTNSIPTEEYCLKLSNERAKTVAEYLYQKGIPQYQVSHKGYGKSKPIADNKTAQGRKRNQRVEIKILSIE